MSWFSIPYSKRVIEREEKLYKRKYGKTIKRVSESNEYTLLPSDEDLIDSMDLLSIDENKDEKFDYSDLDD